MNVIVISSKKWTISHPKFYTEYKYPDTHKICISFEHTVSSDRSRFAMLNQGINSGIWSLEAIYLPSSVPCKVKTLALNGLTFTVLDYDFIWFNFYWDFEAQSTIKKPASSSVTAQIFTELKAMQAGVHLETSMFIP